jgi:hypothetical protein
MRPVLEKQKIIGALVLQLEDEVKLLTKAALEAREAATHEESKAEDKYDTRGLEASYLAGAQAKRVFELRELIKSYQFLELKKFGHDEAIAATALVRADYKATHAATPIPSTFFIVPKGGGHFLDLEGQKIQVVSPTSKIGHELIGRKLGESFEIAVASGARDYRIVGIF